MPGNNLPGIGGRQPRGGAIHSEADGADEVLRDQQERVGVQQVRADVLGPGVDSIVVMHLLDTHADVDVNGNAGPMALPLAASDRSSQVLKLLMRSAEQPSESRRQAGSDRGQAQTFTTIRVWEGGDPHAVDERGETPLMRAADRGDAGLVDLLLERHVDVDARNRAGQTAVMLAAAGGHADVIRRLAGSGADLDARQAPYGETALMLAAAAGRVEAVRALIEGRAIVDAQAPGTRKRCFDDEGRSSLEYGGGDTALSLAVSRGHTEVARQLLDAHADANIKTGAGDTALAIAAAQGDRDMVMLLMRPGADVNQRSG